MRRVGQARRRDENEAEIVAALRQVGALIMRLSEKGCPDLLVLWRGSLFVLEVKAAAWSHTTTAQAETVAAGWPVSFVRSTDEALRAIGAMP